MFWYFYKILMSNVQTSPNKLTNLNSNRKGWPRAKPVEDQNPSIVNAGLASLG